MDISDLLDGLLADGSAPLMLTVLVFLATAILTFGVMAAVRVRGAVKRRTAGIDALSADAAVEDQGGSLRQSSRKAAQTILDYATKHYGDAEKGGAKVLRQRLIRAGIYDPRAVGYFFAGRLALAIVLAFAAFSFVPAFFSFSPSVFWLAVLMAGGLGYLGPSFYLD